MSSGPEGRTADRILRGEWFGLTSTLDDESEALLLRYQQAVQDGAAEEEIAPLRDRLQDRLGSLFDSPIDELALEIAAALGISQQVVSRHLFGVVRHGRRVGGATKKLRKALERAGVDPRKWV